VSRASKNTAVRFERDWSGKLVHMDLKAIREIPDGAATVRRSAEPRHW
jgi:hypothetical protein